MDILQEHQNTMTAQDLAGFLHVVKLLQDEGGHGSVQVVFDGGVIKDINTVIKPATESRPSQAAKFSNVPLPSLEVMRHNWRQFEIIQSRRFSIAN